MWPETKLSCFNLLSLPKIKNQRCFINQLADLEGKLASIRSNAKKLEEEYNKICKESEKKHKKLISLKEKYKQLCEKSNSASKINSDEDMKKELEDKDATISQLKDKIDALEKYKAKKKKQCEKELDHLNKQLADGEQFIEDAKKQTKSNQDEVAELKKSIRHNQLEPIDPKLNTPSISHNSAMSDKRKDPIKTKSASNKKRTLLTVNQ